MRFLPELQRVRTWLIKPRGAEHRAPCRTLAEFAREIGVSVFKLSNMKGRLSDFPAVSVQNGARAYYQHQELKVWWAKHKDAT